MPADNSVLVRLRLLGSNRFAADSDRASRSVRGIGTAARDASVHARIFDSTSSAAGSTVAALGRASKIAGAAIGVAGLAGAKMGIEFNASMEQNQVAFAQFLGSTSKAKAYLDDLYKLAANTPFEFPQLTDAARKFLAFGFSAKDTKSILMTVGDTVAGLGGGGPEIDRLTMAFGQMQAKGKASSEELMQMAELGVPALKILQKQLGLSGTELQDKLQKGAISSKTAIGALKKGMDQTFGGASARQAKTFSGQWSTMKDNATQALGAITKPLFDLLRTGVFPKLNKQLGKVQSFLKADGLNRSVKAITAGFEGRGQGYSGFLGFLSKVGGVAGKAFGVVKTYIQQFLQALAPAQPFLQNVLIPLLKGVGMGILGGIVMAFKFAIPVITIIAKILGAVGTALRPLRGAFQSIGMVIGFVFGGPILGAIKIGGRLGMALRLLRAPFQLVSGAAGLLGRMGAAAARVLGRVFPAAAATVRGALGGMVGFIRGGVGRITGAARSILSGVRGVFSRVGTEFLNLGKKLIGFIARGIRSSASAVRDAIMSIIPGPLRGVMKKIPGIGGLFRARGGAIGHTGSYVVGERGPEVVRLPSGSSVTPAQPNRGTMLQGGVFGDFQIVVPVNVHGREVARASATVTENDMLRKR